MDIKISVSTLQGHSEHLRKLSTQLSADLSKLKLALSAQEQAADTEELTLFVELAELNSSLFAATDNFYQHLHTFLERSKKTGNGLAE